ncbi:hypothetical protein CPLU01_00397 [Colletotrichum plurivorum]|uniref:Uncharacterized protein n=1 Tax=Colletotrichum plurivorum TaxID=2175906 RepID=A0A8H6U6H6_9PEZI|nr:hypothetical protein CPLU01_00397 [Colletotrichum plurivorum]
MRSAAQGNATEKERPTAQSANTNCCAKRQGGLNEPTGGIPPNPDDIHGFYFQLLSNGTATHPTFLRRPTTCDLEPPTAGRYPVFASTSQS